MSHVFQAPEGLPQSHKRIKNTHDDDIIKNIFLDVIDPHISKTKLIEKYNILKQKVSDAILINSHYTECKDVTSKLCTKKTLCSFCIALIEYYFKKQNKLIFQYLSIDTLNKFFVCPEDTLSFNLRKSWKLDFSKKLLHEIYSTLNSSKIEVLHKITSKYYRNIENPVQCKAFYLKRLLLLLNFISNDETLKHVFFQPSSNDNNINSSEGSANDIPVAVAVIVDPIPVVSDLKVFIDNDTVIIEEEKQVIFTQKVTLDARQHLAVQRFTKFKDIQDKACFLFHGVGTGKTLTSLAIALSNLSEKNTRVPLKILIIAPQGLFNASFKNDAEMSGIYTYNYTEYNGIESLNCLVKIEDTEYLVQLIGVNYFSLIEKHNEIFHTLKDINVLICDEAHHLLTDRLKNTKTIIIKDTRFFDFIQSFDQHIFLTGTPVQKSLDDLIEISMFLNKINNSNKLSFESDKDYYSEDGLYKVFNRPAYREPKQILKFASKLPPVFLSIIENANDLIKGGGNQIVTPNNSDILEKIKDTNIFIQNPTTNNLEKILDNKPILEQISKNIYGVSNKNTIDNITVGFLTYAILREIAKQKKGGSTISQSGGEIITIFATILVAAKWFVATKTVELACDVMSQVLEYLYAIDIDLLIKHTQTYVSVYNYDYNLFAIDTNKYYVETKNAGITEKNDINADGNKNSFPNKHIIYIPIVFTETQIHDIDEYKQDPDIFRISNDIGCGCDPIEESKVFFQLFYLSDLNRKNELRTRHGYSLLNQFKQLEPSTLSNNNNYYCGLNIEKSFEQIPTSDSRYFVDFKHKISSYLPNPNLLQPTVQDEKKRFQNILRNLLVVRSGYVLCNNRYNFHPHYVIHKSSSEINIEYYLPIFYPTSKNIMYSFCKFLDQSNYRYLLMDSDDKIQNINSVFEYGSKYTFPIMKINERNDSPICIIISPTHTEGFSFVYNPAILVPGLCLTSGDQEQVYGRILRKYSRPASHARYDKIVYQYFGSSKEDIENIDTLSVVYGTGNLENGVSSFVSIADPTNIGNIDNDIKEQLLDYCEKNLHIDAKTLTELKTQDVSSIVDYINEHKTLDTQVGVDDFRDLNRTDYYIHKFVKPIISRIPRDIHDKRTNYVNNAKIMFKSFFLSQGQIQSYIKKLKKPVVSEFLHFESIDKILSINNQYFKKLLMHENINHGSGGINPMDLTSNAVGSTFCKKDLLYANDCKIDDEEPWKSVNSVDIDDDEPWKSAKSIDEARGIQTRKSRKKVVIKKIKLSKKRLGKISKKKDKLSKKNKK